ncbi:hypothetical protein FERRO_06210 [Ferrovum sp. JA12]|uniref:hypothetical protein n=1 Tax=Ferrovum sp. JA12 TaxID=1356299 RepID=UPI000702E7D4|nr:hypothetical protein [Ferrovum sp. JA12]KRH79553.1 hypothetical protein FERRO_06210 [Ferrovum sp. JA12]
MLDKKPDHFDGLVAEWIGEVGQLHQKIQQLPKAMDEALLPTIRLLNDLSKQRVDVKTYSMQSTYLPSNPISSLQTVLIAGLSFGFGFGAQAIHLSAFGAATVGITVGVIVSQATLYFQKNQENRLKLVKPKKASTSWTEADFQRAIVNTKISIRTVAACRDVLVDNASIGAAAITHQILPGQIYKALPELREREMLSRI